MSRYTIPGFFENCEINGNDVKERGIFGKKIYTFKDGALKETGLFGKTVLIIKNSAIYAPGFLGKKLYNVTKNGEVKEIGFFGKVVGYIPTYWFTPNEELIEEPIKQKSINKPQNHVKNTSADTDNGWGFAEHDSQVQVKEILEKNKYNPDEEIGYVADFTNVDYNSKTLSIPKKYNKIIAVAPALIKNGLEYIKIHENIISILTKNIDCNAAFIVDEMNEHYSSENGLLYNKDKSSLLKVPRGLSLNGNEINCNTINIESYAFYFSVTSRIIIPNNIKKLSSNAFLYCSKLKYIYIPKSVNEIDKNAFENCGKFTIETDWESIPDGWNIDFSCVKEIKWNVKYGNQ